MPILQKSVMFQASKPLNQAFLKTHMVCPINPEKWFDASENGLMVISTLRKLVNFHRNIFQSVLLKRMEKQVVYHIFVYSAICQSWC